MRVIAGSRRGIPLKSLPGNTTRPTSDKVKESLFNKIGPYFDGGTVVELFGGSGSISLEALSRGMEQAIVFEKNAKAVPIIKANADKCRFADQIHIERTDARNAVKRLQARGAAANLLFIDPPYAEVAFYGLAEELIQADLVAADGIVVCEHDKHIELPENYLEMKRADTALYGNTAITIYRWPE